MNADDADLMSIFCAAVERTSPAERAAFVAEACGQNAELRSRIDALLRAHDEAGGFLPEQAASAAATIERRPAEHAGTVIGPYKLLELIGEGGMGTVWMAQQTEPVKRVVALKLIKPGMDSRQIIARFEAERQALALMDHPNIAKVFDGGMISYKPEAQAISHKPEAQAISHKPEAQAISHKPEAQAKDQQTAPSLALQACLGRPYFVMELVKGIPITKYCDEHHLTPRQRLELFVPVCHAIQHAHQKGIIHRDLKPSNVLVALYDGKPVPKVIDFGVAKAAGQPLTEKTLVTGFGNIVGTLEYMSPEQAEINQLDIDTRSDVYSLGVLLYELLTGSTPFSRKDLEKAGMLEMLRVIREQEPSKPSTKLSTAEGLPTLAANRGTEPAKLTKLVRGELDWIVMKALEKDRNRRYETANGFAMDVQRYLADEPVLACPPSAGYRLRKFIRRKKRALAAAAVLGVAMLVAIGGVAWSVGWANRDREARQADVDQKVNLALKEAERLGEQGKWPEALSAAKRADGLLAGGASEALRERVRELRRDVEMVLRLENARVQGLGHAKKDDFFNRDAMDKAYTKAFADYGIDVAALPIDQAAELIRARPIRQELAGALDAWALEGTMAWAAPQGSPVTARRDKLLAISRAADPDELRNRVRDALQTPRVGPEFADHLAELARSPQVRALPPSTLCALSNILPHWGRAEDALALLRDAQQRHPDDFWINFWLAGFFDWEGDEGIRFYSAALALRPDSIAALEGLGRVLGNRGRLDEATACFTKTVELQPEYARAHVNLGSALQKQGKLDKAIACYRKAIELDPESGQAYEFLGRALEAKGEQDDAIDCFKKAFGIQPNDVDVHDLLSDALVKAGRPDEILATDRKAVELDPKNADKLTSLGSTLERLGRLDEAIDCFHRAIASNPTRYTRRAFRGLVTALCEQGQLDEAIATSQKAHEFARYYIAEDDAMNRAIRQAARLKTDDAEMRRYGLGGTYAQLGRWKDAAAAFDHELGVNPTIHERWYLAAAVHAATGDLEGYRRTCRGMLKQFGDTDRPQAAERTVKACLLLPDALSAADFDRVQKLAERAVAGTEKDGYYRYFVLAKGLADYRAGRHEDAIKWLETFPPNAGGTHWDATKFAVLAMAEHDLGRALEAQGSLAKAKAILAKMPDPAKGRPFDSGNWHDWVHAQVLCHEAEELMKK